MHPPRLALRPALLLGNFAGQFGLLGGADRVASTMRNEVALDPSEFDSASRRISARLCGLLGPACSSPMRARAASLRRKAARLARPLAGRTTAQMDRTQRPAPLISKTA